MSISRYILNKRIVKNGKSIFITNKTSSKIYKATSAGEILVSQHILQEGERLDTLAFQIYGNSSYWWIIAAASGIGWGMQVPPGTILNIPKNLDIVYSYVG